MDDEKDELITEFKASVDKMCLLMKKDLDVKNARQIFSIFEDYIEKKKLLMFKLIDDDINDKLINVDHLFNNGKIDIAQNDKDADNMHDINFVNVNDLSVSVSLLVDDHDIDASNMHDETFLMNSDEQSSVNCKRIFSIHDDSFDLEIHTDTRHVTFEETMLLYTYENDDDDDEEEEEEENENENENENEKEKEENDNSNKKISKNYGTKNDNLNKPQKTTRSHEHDKENENFLLIKNNKSNKTPKKSNDNKIVKNIKGKENNKTKKSEKTIVTRSASCERYNLRPRV